MENKQIITQLQILLIEARRILEQADGKEIYLGVDASILAIAVKPFGYRRKVVQTAGTPCTDRYWSIRCAGFPLLLPLFSEAQTEWCGRYVRLLSDT